MYRPTTTSSILFGLLAIVAGIVALAWPGVTVLALVLLFAVYAFIAGGLQFTLAFGSRGAGPLLGHLLLALIDLAAGVVAVAWPVPTALVLVLVVGIWAVSGGFLEFFAAFRSGEQAGTRATFLLGGLVAVAFGVVVLARPGLGAVTLALLFGLFTFAYGVWQITVGIHLHTLRRSLDPPARERKHLTHDH
jgi:uncharacterized membrane protein HdeD (DUF308 family)